MKKETEMSRIPCPKCAKQAEEVINAEKKVRVGWWCTVCNHFEQAIYRERKVA